MNNILLAISVIQVVIQGVTTFAAFDFWRSSKRQHALYAGIALLFMFIKRTTSFFAHIGDLPETPLDIFETSVLPTIITFAWFITTLSSKTKVGNYVRTK